MLTAIFAPLLATHDPLVTNPAASLARAGPDALLGADFMGRDMWSRIIYGARISLAVGIGATVLGCVGRRRGRACVSGYLRRLGGPGRCSA